LTWSERTVVITGASGGIGAALAEEATRRGASALLVSRRREALDGVAANCHGRAHSFVADVTKREEVRHAVAAAIGQLGHIDVWVNNAGQGITRNPSELTESDVDDMIRSNVKSALYGMQEVLPHFRERNAGQIINVSSMLGRVPWATFRSAYSGSKHFLNALTANFRTEIQQTHPGIQVSLVSPGVVRTEFGANALHGGPDSRELPYSQSAEEVAIVIADLMDSRRPDVYTREGSRERIAAYFAETGEDP
jgi:short-subunit dehydrogenase